MKKWKIATSLLGVIGAATIPLSVVVSCGGTTSKNQVIEEATYRKIKTTIESERDVIYQPIVGKKLVFYSSFDPVEIIKKNTGWMGNIKTKYIEKDNATGAEMEVVSGQHLVKENKSYFIRVLMKPNSSTMWWDKTDITRIVDTRAYSSSQATKSLEIDAYKDIKFDKAPLGEYLFRTKIKDYDTYIDRVSLRIDDFQSRKIGLTGGGQYYPVDQYNTRAVAGNEITFKVYATPQNEFAWKDGNPFEEREITSLVNNEVKLQWDLTAESMRIDYASLGVGSPAPSININTFYGAVNKYDPSHQGFPYSTLQLYTSATEEAGEPEGLAYGSDVYQEMKIWNPEGPDKPYMSTLQDLTGKLPANNKYVNFKYTVHDFYKNSGTATLDKDIINLYHVVPNLPYTDKPNKDKIIKNGDDLEIYTYSIPYKI